MTEIAPESVAALRERVGGGVLTPQDAPYDFSRAAWNLAIEQRPALIALPSSSEEVAACVRFAGQHGLGVAVQATGHGVGRPADDALLILTRNLNRFSVDPATQTAHIEAGVRWGSVLRPAQEHGLAPLIGSATGVGAVGYTLGGGMGWLARKFGLASDQALGFEAVTAEGEIIRANADQHPDLFWALRGGGGANYALVTAMEQRLFPVTQVYGGSLLYPAELAQAVFRRYRDWAAALPDEMTSSVLIMNYPNSLDLPDPVRGRAMAVVRGCYTGDLAAGKALLDEWRSWQPPAFDLFGAMPFMSAAIISHDPPGPLASFSDSTFLADLSDSAIDAILAHSLPQDGPPVLAKAEIHHLGGAMARVAEDASAVSHREHPFLLHVIAAVPTSEAAERAREQADSLRSALAADRRPATWPNFLDGAGQVARVNELFSAGKAGRLQAVKAAYDPDNRFRYGFGVPGE